VAPGDLSLWTLVFSRCRLADFAGKVLFTCRQTLVERNTAGRILSCLVSLKDIASAACQKHRLTFLLLCSQRVLMQPRSFLRSDWYDALCFNSMAVRRIAVTYHVS